MFARAVMVKRIAEILQEKEATAQLIRARAVEKSALTEEWVIERLKYLTDVSLRGAPLLDSQGRPIPGQFTGKRDGATAVRCLELAAKIKGMLVMKHELGRPGEFTSVSDEELLAEAREAAQVIGIPFFEGSGSEGA